jgi:phosphoglycolate phosphatase
MRYRSVVFDIDGALVDTTADVAAALDRLLDTHGLPRIAESEVREGLIRGLRELLRRHVRSQAEAMSCEAFDDLLDDALAIYREEVGRRARPLPGAAAMLEELDEHGVMLSVLTNKNAALTVELLDRFGLREHLDYMMPAVTGMPRMPDPTGLLQLMSHSHVPPQATLLVGASELDRLTARNAEIDCALVAHRTNRSALLALGPTYVVEGLSHLPRVVLGTRPSGAHAPPM